MMEQVWFRVACVCLLMAIADGQTCMDSGQGQVQENKRMKNHLSTKLEALSFFECIAMCKANGIICKSVNFDVKSQTCEFNDEDSHGAPGDVEAAADVLFSDVSDWSKAITGSCSDTVCGKAEMCVVERNDRPHCIALNCGRPQSVDNADVIYTNTKVGAAATYICNDGHLACGVSNGNFTSRCLESGKWSNVSGHCGLRLFVMKTVSRKRVPFHCLKKDKWKVTIAATPTKNTFFTMIVARRNPFKVLVRVALHIDHNKCKQSIQLGSSKSTDCGLPAHYSFSANKQIDLTLQFDRTSYQLMIQGRLHATYNETNGLNANYILPFGDVRVTEIKFEY